MGLLGIMFFGGTLTVFLLEKLSALPVILLSSVLFENWYSNAAVCL
jgi:hypothetical protein